MSSADRPIDVVHVVLSLAIGGLENIVVHLAGRSSDRVRPRVICLETLGELAPRLADLGIPVECIGSPQTPVTQSIARLRRRLRELSPDIVHTHNEKSHIHGALALLGRGHPVLIHTRHGRWQVPTRMARVANRLAIHRSRFVVCVSADAGDIARQEGAAPDRIRILKNAIDVPSFVPSGTRSTARAVTVARLAPVKDIGTMLRAVAMVRATGQEFRLDVVGDGPSRVDLEVLAGNLGVAGAVTFHGAHGDPRPFLSQAAMFLQSSLSEGISLTVLEAMASALPVVATDVGGNREVVEVGQTGFLVRPQDPQALADAVLRLLREPRLAQTMGQAGRERAAHEFDLSRMVRQYEELYAEALVS